MSPKVHAEYNRVIEHAIKLGVEAAPFLHCWNEGNWAGCREFGFEPNLEVYQVQTVAEWKSVPAEPTDEMLYLGGEKGNVADDMAAKYRSQIWAAMLDAAPEQPAPVPLTEEQKDAMWESHEPTARSWGHWEWYMQGLGDAERAHGVKREKA